MAWQENQPNYFDNSVAVRLPHDSIVKDPDRLAALSGPVVTYNLKDREEGVSTCTTTMTTDSGCFGG